MARALAKYAGARVGDPQQFKEPLERSVLTPPTVEGDEGYVYRFCDEACDDIRGYLNAPLPGNLPPAGP